MIFLSSRRWRCAGHVVVSVVLVIVAATACGGTEVDAGSTSAVATTRPAATGPAPSPGTTPRDTSGSVVPDSTVVTLTTSLPPVGAGGPTTTAAVPTTAALPRTHPVATTTFQFVDPSRKTVSRGSVVAPSRTLTTTVYYPSDGVGPYPLVVFAHGFEIGPVPYAHFCTALANGGYIVAAPSFPLTDKNVAGGNLDRDDLPNQAADVSFVITSVIAAGAGSGAIRGRVDADHVGMVGHSDGADTALDVGYYPGRVDARVKAVAAFAPDAMTGPGGSVGAATPLLLAHGDRDSIVAYSNSKTVWNQVQSHRFFLTLVGANHLPPVQGIAPFAAVLESVTIDFLDRYVAARTTGDQAIVDAGHRDGVADLISAG